MKLGKLQKSAVDSKTSQSTNLEQLQIDHSFEKVIIISSSSSIWHCYISQETTMLMQISSLAANLLTLPW